VIALRRAYKGLSSGVRGGIFLRIAAMFLAVLILPTGAILVAMNSAFQAHDFEETLRSQRYSMTQVVQRFSQFFDHIDQVVMDMVYSQAIQDSLVGKATRRSVNAVISSKSYKEGIYIAYLTNRNELYSSSIITGYESALTGKLPNSAIFQKIDKTYAGLCWSLEDSNLFSPFRVSRDHKSLFAGRHVRHLDLNVSPGYLLVQTMPNQLAALVDDPLMRAGTRYLLIDENGTVVLDSAGELPIGSPLGAPEMIERSRMGQDNYYGDLGMGRSLHIFGALGDTGLTLISYLPESDIRETRNELNQLLFTVALISSAVALALALLFSFYYSRPIMQIARAMRRVRKGELDEKLNIRRSDEIGELANTFNVMTDGMKKLLEQTKRDQQELNHAEINALIYQINPHFLYNTLDSINMLARRSGEERIAVLITELSSLLRITLSGGREQIPVRSELQHAANYLRIMQLRTGKLFEYEILEDESILHVQILKFLLQPLIENAINHGMNYTEEGGLIQVGVRAEGRDLHLSVADNGVGMTDEQVAEVERRLKDAGSEPPAGRGGVGLSNVYRRLRIHYGESGFRMEFLPSGLGGVNAVITLIGVLPR
jgi:sensor histidine kinase YesM